MTDTIANSVIGLGVDATGVTAGIAQATQAVRGFEQAAGGSAAKAGAALSGSLNAAADGTTKLTREQERLIASINSYSSTIGKTRGEVLEFRAAQAGITSQVQSQIDAIKAQEAALRSGGAALKTYGVSAGQTAAAFRQLPAQLTDVVTQLAGGQSPFLILLQQGGQVKDSFGGIGAAARALGSLITPTTAAVAGLAAGFAGFGAAVAHAESLQRSLNTLETQLKATGRAGLQSSEQLKALINELALAPGVTRDAATSVVGELSKVHNIGVDMFTALAAAAVDYAAATGTKVPAAAKTLADAFADPAKGAKTLDDALGTLTSTQLLQIDTMTRQNDLVGAQRVLLDALESSVKGLATNGLTPLQTATNDLGNSWEKAMHAFDQSSGLKTATNLTADLLGKLVSVVNYLPEFEKRWRGAFSGGLNGMVGGALGIGSAPRMPSGPQTGGATGSWETADDAATRESARLAEDGIKRALASAKAYQSETGKIRELTQERNKFTEALANSITAYGKESEQAKAFRDAIAGVDERLKASRKRSAGGAGKAYQDDAATKYIEGIRQAEAAVQAQLDGGEKLTASQKKQAEFVQLIADLKEKKILTAEQKSLLASEEIIKADLARYVALEDQVKAREKATKLAEAEVAFGREMEGISRSIASSQSSRNDQYERTLGTAGLGARARQEVDSQRSVRREFERYMRDATEKASKVDPKTGFSGLNSKAYQDEVVHIKASLDDALAAQRAYFDAEKALREDWSNGAKSALADYVDYVDDAAGRARSLISNSLSGLNGSVTDALWTGNLDSFKQFGDRIGKQILAGIVEQQLTKPIAQWLQGSLNDPDSMVGKLVGGLTSNKSTGENWLGALGLGGGGAPGGAPGMAPGSTAGNPLYVIAVGQGGIAGAVGGAMGSSSNDSWITSIVGAAASAYSGDYGNAAATLLANNSSGDSLDNLFKYTGNFGGRANGGPVGSGSVHQVTENGPELLTVGNKTLLMMGQQGGNVTPMRESRGGDTYINNISVEGQVDRRTRGQIAGDLALQQRQARRYA